MSMKMRIWAILMLCMALAWIALGATSTTVTGAGGALFSGPASFNGIPVTSLRFGIGADITSAGVGSGDFQSTLIGASEIVVEGKASAGSAGALNTATFSGTCSVDLGNGTPPLQNVPFIVTVTNSTIGLTLGATSFPVANLNQGTLTVK